MNNKIMIPAVVGVIGIGLGFAGGTMYAKQQTLNNGPMYGNFGNFGERGGNTPRGMGAKNGNAVGNAQGNTGMGVGMKGNGAVTGEVTAKDGKTLTIKMLDGSSRIVNLSDSTTYRMSTEASLDKIEVGTKVATFGSSNSDGSTTATSIEINPVMRGLNDLK